jgi:hypothetical protein
MEGTLKINDEGTWRQRYFRLRGSTLTVTKARSSSSVRGTYALDAGVSVTALSGTAVDRERKFCFQLTKNAAFALVLEAPTQYEQTVWLNALRDVCNPPKGSVSLGAVARAAVASARSRALGSSPKGAANALDSDRQMLQQSAVVGRRLDAHRRSVLEVGASIEPPTGATTAPSSSSSAGSAETERSPPPRDGEWIRCEGPTGPGSDFMWSGCLDSPGWGRIRQLTPANAQPYYFNQALGLTQWNRPAAAAAALSTAASMTGSAPTTPTAAAATTTTASVATPSPRASRSAGADLWRRAIDPATGSEYFFNATRNDTQWVLPEGAVVAAAEEEEEDVVPSVSAATRAAEASAVARASPRAASPRTTPSRATPPRPSPRRSLGISPRIALVASLRARVARLEAENGAMKADAARRDAELKQLRLDATASVGAAAASSAAGSAAGTPASATVRTLTRQLKKETAKNATLLMELDECHDKIIHLKMTSRRRNGRSSSGDEEGGSSCDESESESESESDANWDGLDDEMPVPRSATPQWAIASFN